ncbi:MAG: DUF4097 family beta strand repeat-containing protein [Draconibacterium sp.]
MKQLRNSNMKTQFKVKAFISLAIVFALLSYKGNAHEDRTPTITKTFEMNQRGSLNAASSGGGVVVKTHNEKSVEVQLFVRKNGKVLSPSDPSLDEILEMYDLEIEKQGTEITANVKRKIRNMPWNNSGISLTIIVPREMSCDVSSSGGGLTISGVDGTHNFSSSGGGVELENVSGTTKARSSGGGVKATNQNGDVELSSSGGGVRLEEAYGNVKASSSGGGVHLTNIHGDVDASSSGGGVSVTGEAGRVKAKSSGGSVKVDIKNLSKELSLASSGGGIDAVIHDGDKLGLDLDLSSDRVNIDLHNFSGKSEKNRVKGTMNNGGIPVYMRSSGGSVNVGF